MKTDFTGPGLLAAAAVAAISGVLALTAQARAEYPDKPVTLVVPYNPGGSTETLARVFSKALSKQLGQPVVVKTRPGGGGAVGATEIANGDPDGYTIMLSSTESLTWTPLVLDVEYDVNSFTYIAQISEYQQAVVVREESPDATFADLIARSKANPGLTFADQGALSRSIFKYIAEQEGLEWTGIPTDGGGEMIPLLIAGKIDFSYSGGVHTRYPGKVRVIASMNPQRLSTAPDAPSVKENYGIAMPSHMVIVGPKAVPGAIVAKLNVAIEAATKDEEYLELLQNKLKFPSKYVGPEALTTEIEETIVGLRKVAEASR